MTRPISMDLRERAMARLADGQSVRQVAAARPRKIVGDHEAWLLERIETPFTLRGLVSELAARGLKVDYRTVWKAVHRAGYSFKKNRAGRRATPAGRCTPQGALETPPETG